MANGPGDKKKKPAKKKSRFAGMTADQVRAMARADARKKMQGKSLEQLGSYLRKNDPNFKSNLSKAKKKVSDGVSKLSKTGNFKGAYGGTPTPKAGKYEPNKKSKSFREIKASWKKKNANASWNKPIPMKKKN